MKNNDEEESIAARMQGIAQAVDNRLPKGYGFVVFCFKFGAPPDFKGDYISNAKREDVVAMLRRFVAHCPMPKPEDN
jgi:hypothetical protein